MTQNKSFISYIFLIKFYVCFLAILNINAVKLYAQCNVWAIPTNYVQFQPALSINPLPNSILSNFPSNAMQDPNGNLFFSVNHGYVTDGANTIGYQIINPASTQLGDEIFGTTEYLIVPVPGNCHKFYLIAGEMTGNSAGPNPHPFYIRLNTDPFQLEDANGNFNNLATDLAGGNGFTNPDLHAGTIHFAATPLRTATNDRFLYIESSLNIYRYKITATGITYDNYSYSMVSNGGPQTDGSSRLRSEMEIIKLANGDYRLAAPFEYAAALGLSTGIVVYNVDVNTGVLTQSFVYNIGTSSTLDEPTGLEFSPDGNYLYIAQKESPYLIAINANTGLFQTSFSISSDFKNSLIEIATNGNLYLAAADRLGELTTPNIPSSANWQDMPPGLINLNPPIPLAYGTDVPADQTPDRARRLLPDQIDGENYQDGFLLSDLHCCVDNSQFEVKDNYTAPTGTYTWTSNSNPWNVNTPIRVRKKITIPTGANVTIQDMIFQFGYEGAVEIQKGAVLSMLGTKFTNTSCDIMWLGVNVLGTAGNASLAQNGVLSMSTTSNVSSIENAQEGVSMFNGGQFLGYSAVFYNNWHSITISDNNLPSGSLTNTINASVFQNTGALLSPHVGAKDDYFIKLNNVNNTSFIGTNYFTGGSLGISSNDSKYNLSLARFTDVINAIWSKKIYAGFSSEHIFTNNIFQDCFNSIRIDGGYNDLITDNIFNPSNIDGSQSKNYIGIQMESSGAFKILDNTFYKCQYAIYINNSGSLGGRISTTNGSGNQFISCWRGVNALGDNSALQIKCNVFQNEQIPAEYSTAWYIGGKLADQGTNTPSNNQSPAGNKFYSKQNYPTRIDLTSVAGTGTNGINFTYFYHSTSGLLELLPSVNIYIARFNTGILYDPSQSCLGVNLMTLANNNPVTAQQIINAELNPVRRQLLVNELIYWYDTNNQNAASITYLETVGNKAAEKVLFNKYIKSGDLKKSKDLLHYDNPHPDIENTNYVDFNKVLYDWAKKNKTAFQMKNSEENTIRDVSESNTSSAVLAQGILNLVFGEPYLQPTSDTIPLRLGEASIAEPKAADTYYLSPAYPNPTNNQTIISYVLLDNTKDAEIIVTDLLGRPKQVFKLNGNENYITVSTNDFAQGTYTYRLLINTATVSSRTFIVIK